jgi:hypothetical protein
MGLVFLSFARGVRVLPFAVGVTGMSPQAQKCKSEIYF